MNKKNVFKIILDIAMIISLALFYQSKVISLTFHEVGGLIILGVFLIHILLNYKWVLNISKRIFSKNLPFKTKFGYIIDILLLLSFVLVGLSGIMISKIVFHLNASGGINWKTIHIGAAAWGLVFVGIHVGLHYSFITGMLKKMIGLPEKAGKFLGYILCAVLIVYGCYSFQSNGFYQWLISPFTNQSQEYQHNDGFTPTGDGNQSEFSGQKPDVSENRGAPSMEQSGGGNHSRGDQNNQNWSENASGDNTQQGEFPQGDRNGGDFQQGGAGQSGIGNIIKTFFDYFSIAILIASITILLVKLLTKKKKPIHVTLPMDDQAVEPLPLPMQEQTIDSSVLPTEDQSEDSPVTQKDDQKED